MACGQPLGSDEGQEHIARANRVADVGFKVNAGRDAVDVAEYACSSEMSSEGVQEMAGPSRCLRAAIANEDAGHCQGSLAKPNYGRGPTRPTPPAASRATACVPSQTAWVSPTGPRAAGEDKELTGPLVYRAAYRLATVKRQPPS